MNKLIKEINNNHFQLRFCEKFDEKSHFWNLKKHKHSVIEILYFLDGNANVVISEEQMHISLYNMVVYPKESFHQETLDLTQHQKVICLWIDSTDFDFPQSVNMADSNGELLGLMELIHSESKKNSNNISLLEHLLKALCILIVLQSQEKHKDNLGLVLQYMNGHFNEPIAIKQLADLIHVSESYLIRRFKKEMDKTPIQYLNTLRIEVAKRLLVTTNKTIEEISDTIGCNSPKYFSRLFKKLTLETPGSFRKLNSSL